MVQNPLYDLAGTCIKAVEYISRAEKAEEYKRVIEGLRTIMTAAQSILQGLEQSGHDAVNSKLYCKNIMVSGQKIIDDIGKNHQRIDFEICPFCYELQRAMKIELQLISAEEFRENRAKAFQTLRQSKKKKYKYQVAIVVYAYNKLEYTKKAIESIYQYTDFEKNRVELITVNNGSTDGTEEYFAALPNTKKINLAYNIRGNAVYQHIAESKYIVGFSNDAVATSSWLENLLTCIESDDQIFWVVPTCNQDSISNRQGIEVPYHNCFEDLSKMQEFAEKYNQSNPSQWEDRSMLMPFISIGLSQTNEYISTMDPAYTQIEFSDDDTSTWLRRNGFRLILAKDTFMHHFGSITLREEQRNSSSLENMRKVYYDKWGVDAWESRAEFPGIEHALMIPTDGYALSVLMLEPRFGGSFLQIKNFYRSHGCSIADTAAIVVDQRYQDDAMGMYTQTLVGTSFLSGLAELHGKFDLISAGRFLGDLRQEHTIIFLEKLYEHLKPGGMIVLPVMNYASIGYILSLLMNGGTPAYNSEAYEFAGCSLDVLRQSLDRHPYLHEAQLVMTTVCNPEQATIAENFADFVDTRLQHLDAAGKEAFLQHLKVQSGFLRIYRRES